MTPPGRGAYLRAVSDEEFKALFPKTDAALARLTAEQAKLTAEQAKVAAERQRTERVLRELGRQIGGLSNKFGSYTEGLTHNSLRNILQKDLGMETILHEVEISRGSRNAEYDMLGFRNGKRPEAVLVEIKSHLGERELQQTLKKLKQFFTFFPEHKGKRLRGLIAAVHLPKGMAERVLQAGLYLASGADDNFKLLKPPRGFKPAAF